VVDFAAVLEKERARVAELVADHGALELARLVVKLERQLGEAHAERDRVVASMSADRNRLFDDNRRLRGLPPIKNLEEEPAPSPTLLGLPVVMDPNMEPGTFKLGRLEPRNFDGGEDLGGSKLRRRASLLS
jgi:hypothetical protein